MTASEHSRPSTAMGAVVRGIGWVGAGHVVGQIAWFASLLAVAATLPPDALGTVTIGMVMVQVAWLLVGSGTRGSFVTTRRLTRRQVRYSVLVNVGGGIAFGLAAAILAVPFLRLFGPGADPAVVQALAMSVALFGLSIVPLALLQKELQFKRHAGVNAAAAVISSVVAVVAALLGAGVWALVVRQVLFQAGLAAFAWPAARGALAALPDDPTGGRRARRPRGAPWFFGLAVIAFASLNVDFVIVGRFTDVAKLGLYSLAFTIAFAPMTQFAWQVGKVLFPTAASSRDPAELGPLAAKSVRLAALLLLPVVPPAIALAPAVLPALLGPEWSPMVVPLQLLLVAGVAHALVAIVREFLLGANEVRFCVRLEAAWLLLTAAVLAAAVALFGIVGAAAAHLLLVLPLGAAYAWVGLPRIGQSPAGMLVGVRGVLVPVAAEGLVVAVALATASAAGAGTLLAGVASALAGAATAAWLLGRGPRSPLREGRAVLLAARTREVPA